MRISRTLVGVMVACMLTVGCGGSSGDGGTGGSAQESKDTAIGADGEVAGSELPYVVEEPEEELLGPNPELGSAPERGDATEKVLNELKVGTLRMARAPGKMVARCARGTLTLKAGATTRCGVHYGGVEVPWNVTLADDYEPGSGVLSYRAEPLKGLLTAKAAYGQWYELQSARKRDELRCSEIPDVELVELDAPTNYKCQYLVEGSDEDSDEETWSDRVIVVKKDGVEFETP